MNSQAGSIEARFAALKEQMAVLSQLRDPSEILKRMLRIVGGICQCDRLYVIESTRDGRFVCRCEWCAEHVFSISDLVADIPPELCHRFGQLFGQEQYTVCHDLETLRKPHPLIYRLLKTQAVNNFTVVTLYYLGQVLGYLVLVNAPVADLNKIARELVPYNFAVGSLLSTMRIKGRLAKIGYEDKLTGVSNRHGLFEFVAALDRGKSIGIIYGDVNDLKVTNDTLGHEAGDTLLKEVADCLIRVFGLDHVFRLGGDEFLVAVSGLTEEVFLGRIASLRHELELKKHTMAMGVLWQNSCPSDFEALISKADTRMYADKRSFYERQQQKLHKSDSPVYNLLLEIKPHDGTFRILQDPYARFARLSAVTKFPDFLGNMLQNAVHPDDRKDFMRFWDLDGIVHKLQSLGTGHTLFFEYRLREGEGWIWVEDVVVMFNNGGEPVLICFTHDIGSRRMRERLYFSGSSAVSYQKSDLEISDDFFARSDDWRTNSRCISYAVCAVDINYFKLFNEIYGFEEGNEMLRRLHSLLEEDSIRRGGLCGYLGADNFCFIVPLEAAESQRFKADYTEMLMRAAFVAGFSPAIGICLCRDRDTPISVLYDRALIALSSVRGNYHEHINFYDPALYQNIKSRQLLLSDAQKGFRSGEFTFYLQPNVDLKTGKVLFAEVLVRWIKDGRPILPSEFRPAMEENGYICAVDRFIWERVCIWLRGLMDAGITPVPCSVNISRVDFYFCDVSGFLSELVKRYDIPRALIEIEVDENALADSSADMLSALRRLQQQGFRLIIDNFGNGISSLGTLGEINADILKVSRSFMSNKVLPERRLMLLDSIINLAHMLNMLVVAEGVESADQVQKLSDISCDMAQGFYFYKPMAVSDFEKLLTERGRVAALQFEQQRSVGLLNLRQLLLERLLPTSILDVMIGPAAVYELRDGGALLAQTNEAFCSLIGISRSELALCRTGMPEAFSGPALLELFSLADQEPEKGAAGVLDIVRGDGSSLKTPVQILPMVRHSDSRYYIVRAGR